MNYASIVIAASVVAEVLSCIDPLLWKVLLRMVPGAAIVAVCLLVITLICRWADKGDQSKQQTYENTDAYMARMYQTEEEFRLWK